MTAMLAEIATKVTVVSVEVAGSTWAATLANRADPATDFDCANGVYRAARASLRELAEIVN